MITTIGYVMKDKHATTIMTKEKHIGDCSILLTEFLATPEAVVIVTQKKLKDHS